MSRSWPKIAHKAPRFCYYSGYHCLEQPPHQAKEIERWQTPIKTDPFRSPAAMSFASAALAEPALPRREAAKRFNASWKYYQWRIEQGDDYNDLEYLLVRIYEKYKNEPVNIAAAPRT
jgi:hypothetical protein